MQGDTQSTRAGLVARMVASSRFFVLLAMISLFLAFVALMVSTLIATVGILVGAVGGEYGQNVLVGKLIKQADTALLATVLYVLALGLYSLFVDDRIPMPSWLRISTLTDLKELLAGVVVVAIAVIFLGQALTWDGRQNLLIPGLSSAAVIAALSLFLWQASRERRASRAAGPDDGRPDVRRPPAMTGDEAEG